MAKIVSVTRARAGPRAEHWVPVAGSALVAATIAVGLALTASGTQLGAALAPFLWRWRPHVEPLTLVTVAVVAGGAIAAPRLRARPAGPLGFAVLTFALGLALRVALGIARGGVPGLYAVYELGKPESASEYLPALPALDFGARLFLDTFAQVGESLPVNAVGHPPGLLLLLHWLQIGTAEGMAALTIGAGALSVPLVYLLARELLDERRARNATLLYVFAPSALLYGATSADALFATVALVAAVALAIARGRRGLAGGAVALAAASFFSYANLAIGAWAALLALLRQGPRRAVCVAAACAAGLAGFYGLLYLVTGFDPIGAIASAEHVYSAGIASHRPYAFWAFGSTAAFLVALGLPTAWFAMRSLGAGFAPAAALALVLLVSALLGFTKGETERIYLFFVPLACVAAAATLPDRRVPLAVGALAVQALGTELLVYTVW